MVEQRTTSQETRTLPKINLQCFDVSHAGVNHFLDLIEPDPSAFLSKCLHTVINHLYDDLKHGTFHLPEVRSITIIVRPMKGIAFTTGNIIDDKHKEIHISADYVLKLFGQSSVSSSRVAQSAPSPTPTIAPDSTSNAHNVLPDKGRRAAKHEIEGVIVHEMVHTLQYTGNDSCPGGLIEGIADWVRLKANLAPPHWKEDPVNKSWDSGDETTAFFLRWTSQWLMEPLLVPKLNEAFRHKSWGNGHLFHLVCGKTIEEAWKEYIKTNKT